MTDTMTGPAPSAADKVTASPAPATPTAAPTPAPVPAATPTTPATRPTTAPAPASTSTGALGTDPAFLAYLRGAGLSQADATAIAQQGTAKVNANLSNGLADQQRNNQSADLNLGTRLEGSGMSNSTTGQYQVAQQRAGEAARQEALRQTAAGDIQNLTTNLAIATQKGQTGIAGAALSAAPAADATLSAAGAPAPSAPTSSGTSGGLVAPFPQGVKTVTGRVDQGQDMSAPPNTPVLAAASGTIRYGHDPSGFGGTYPILMLDNPVGGNTGIYYGHIGATVPEGTRVTAGQPIGQTLATPGGNAASQPGWLEMGWWGANGPTGDGAGMASALSGATPGAASAAAPGAPANGALGTDPAFLAYLRGVGLSQADAEALAQQGSARLKAGLANSLSDQQRADQSSQLNLGTRLEGTGMSNSTTGQFENTQQLAAQAARQEALRQNEAANEQSLLTNLAMATQQGQTGIAGAALNAAPAADGTLSAAGGGTGAAAGPIAAAILHATPDRRTQLAMLMGSLLESNANPGAPGGGAYQVIPSRLGAGAAADPLQSTQYMLPDYTAAAAGGSGHGYTGPSAELWRSNPELAAQLAAQVAEGPGQAYNVAQSQARVDEAYRQALAILGGGTF